MNDKQLAILLIACTLFLGFFIGLGLGIAFGI